MTETANQMETLETLLHLLPYTDGVEFRAIATEIAQMIANSKKLEGN